MKIKKRLSQHRRDFHAIFVCEHCGHEEELGGYDDSYFHQQVIPKMVCKICGKTAVDYKPEPTRYPDDLKV